MAITRLHMKIADNKTDGLDSKKEMFEGEEETGSTIAPKRVL